MVEGSEVDECQTSAIYDGPNRACTEVLGTIQDRQNVCRKRNTVPILSVSSALSHTPICSSLYLFLPGSELHSAQIKICFSICHIPGSTPAVSNDHVTAYSVTLQQHSVHPKESHPLPSQSHPLPFSSSVFPSSCSLLLLLLPTHSFSIHILEDIYEHETEHVHLHHFQCRGNLHFFL